MTIAKVIKAALVGIAVFVLLYLMAGFVAWDFYWIRDMSQWKQESRIVFMIVFGLTPLAVVTIVLGTLMMD